MTAIDGGEWLKHILSQCCKHWNEFNTSSSIGISILHCQVGKGNRFTAPEMNQKAIKECGNSSKTASFFSTLQPFLEWLTHCLYWGECRDVVSACMYDRNATSVFPKDNLEVLGNTEGICNCISTTRQWSCCVRRWLCGPCMFESWRTWHAVNTHHQPGSLCE